MTHLMETLKKGILTPYADTAASVPARRAGNAPQAPPAGHCILNPR